MTDATGWEAYAPVGMPGPFDVVQAPPLKPSPLSLLTACTVLDVAPRANDLPPDADRPAPLLGPAWDRWVQGFQFLPEIVGPAAGYGWCVTSPMPDGNNCEGIDIVSVFLAVMLDDRSTAGFRASDALDRVRRGLLNHEAWRVENEWWTGYLNKDNAHLNAPNAFLPVQQQSGGDPSSATGLQASLGLLEQSIAYRDAGVGIIHCTPFVFNAWAQRGGIPFRFDGATPGTATKIWTPNGNLVVPGYGYDGTGPLDIDTVQDPETQWQTEQWAYATDSIGLLRGPLKTEPESYEDMSPAITTRNDVPWRAIRPWAIYSNGGLRSAVLVDTTTL